MSERPKSYLPCKQKEQQTSSPSGACLLLFFSGLGLNKCLRYSVPCSQPVMPFATQLCRAFP